MAAVTQLLNEWKRVLVVSMSVVVLNTPSKTTPTTNRSRDVDAIISARKAQLLSAKARNDELYNTLAKHAEARSAQKARQRAPPSSSDKRHGSSNSSNSSSSSSSSNNSARSPEKQLESKAQDESSAVLQRAQQLEATVLTTMQQQMNDLRMAQESSTEEIKGQMTALDEKLAESLDERIRLALEGGGGSRRGSPSAGSRNGSPSHKGSPTHRASLSDRLDAMSAKMTCVQPRKQARLQLV